MKWITRERPKIDRIACPWLVTRFIDKEPEFLYVAPNRVQEVARETGAIPYDIPGVELSHVGELCSFDAFLKKYELDTPALQHVAQIVRGADTSRLDLTPQSPGLFAISLGLSAVFADDHEMLKHGMVMYDALYAWCQSLQTEAHAGRRRCRLRRPHALRHEAPIAALWIWLAADHRRRAARSSAICCRSRCSASCTRQSERPSPT